MNEENEVPTEEVPAEEVPTEEVPAEEVPLYEDEKLSSGESLSSLLSEDATELDWLAMISVQLDDIKIILITLVMIYVIFKIVRW